MSLFHKLKQYLPGSSRSLHAMHGEVNAMHHELDEMNAKLDRLYERVEIADRGINDNINYKFETRTIPKIDRIAQDLDAHDTHMKMFAWENYRDAGETEQQAKERFFHSLPEATGGMRLLQLGCAKLLGDFDALCQENDIPYWINFGTLLGAVRHGGFIPWDDDTDLGMMREDIGRLERVVATDDRYRITLVYDNYVHCRQIRFWYADEDIPCFLDLFIYDWIPQVKQSIGKRHRELRHQMERQMDEDSRLAFWREKPYTPSTDDGAEAIQQRFDSCYERIQAEGLLCDKTDAKGVIWGFDNLDTDQNVDQQRTVVYRLNDLMPLQRLSFEGVDLLAPANPDAFLRSNYGDYYELPSDIHSHLQHVDHMGLSDDDTLKKLRDLVR